MSGQRFLSPRWITFPSPPLRTYFRTVAGRVVPDKVVQHEPLPVCDILLGASAPMQPHDQALAVLAEESTGRRLPITRSEVPVRQ